MQEGFSDIVYEAEQQLLGSLLIAGGAFDPEPIEIVKKIVVANDFYHEPHRLIYQAMLANNRTDHITVAKTMFHNGTLNKEDIPYFHLLLSLAIGIDYEYFAQVVKSNAKEWQTDKRKPRFTGEI